MQLAQLRAEIAPLFGVSDDLLRIRQQSLYREPPLRKLGMTGRGTELRDRANTATIASGALLLLAAMFGGTKESIGPTVAKLWQSRLVTKTGNPLENCKTAGTLLTLLLKRADIRDRLLFCEIDRGVPHLTFAFGPAAWLVSDKPLTATEWQQRIDDAVKVGELSRTFYAPYTPKQWERRMAQALERGEMAFVYRLPATTLHKVAALISQEG